MQWKAIIAIGGICLVLGLLLWLPAQLWARRRLRSLPAESEERTRITPLGGVVYGLMVAVLMAGFSLQYLAPQTGLGHMVSTWPGRLVYTILVSMAWLALETSLGLLGLECWQRPPGAAAARRKGMEARLAEAVASPARQRGYARIATIRGIPLLVHWSFPAGGLLVATWAGVGLPVSLYYSLAYAVLVALHEAGHAVVARALRLKVYRVEISGFGGLCISEQPGSVRDGALLYSAGLLVQLALLLATLGWLAVFGRPQYSAGRALVDTFTLVNVVLLVLNLVPQTSRGGLATDGMKLWQVFRHVALGGPNPFPVTAQKAAIKPAAEAPVFARDIQLETMPGFVPPGFVYGIELLNDRTTPMEFVVTMLTQYLGLSREEAIRLMLHIHNRGGALIALPNAERAEAVAREIVAESARQGHSFACRAVGIEKTARGAVAANDPAGA